MQLCFFITGTLSHNIISHKRDEPIIRVVTRSKARRLNSLCIEYITSSVLYCNTVVYCINKCCYLKSQCFRWYCCCCLFQKYCLLFWQFFWWPFSREHGSASGFLAPRVLDAIFSDKWHPSNNVVYYDIREREREIYWPQANKRCGNQNNKLMWQAASEEIPI